MIILNDTYFVYAHINKLNGKMYIGITGVKKPSLRWGKDGSGYIHCDKFYKAIKKYGWDSFDHEVIASKLTVQEAANMERLLIKNFDTINNGYNIDAGGFACKHSEESIEKIRQANINKIVSEETKQKIKVARAKQVISMDSIMKSAEKNRGKKRSEEFKERSREIKRSFMKRIIVVETNEVFESISEAARRLNINKSSISHACHNNRTINGLHIQFVNA